MPTLTMAKLNIDVNLPSNRAKVVVTTRIRFSQLELAQMSSGLRFKLDCKVWGEDRGQNAWIDADDHLFTFATQFFFPDATPTMSENAKFERDVPLTTLNEDATTDEIYAELILKNLETGATTVLRTNKVEHQFG